MSQTPMCQRDLYGNPMLIEQARLLNRQGMGAWRERLPPLAVNPYALSGTVVLMGAAALLAGGALDSLEVACLAALVAGWAAAWSP